jgi:two-component sensor histidine kinase
VITISEYLKTLTNQIETFFKNPAQNITVSINSENIKMDLDTAIPLGLIVNELITNSFKHAFKNMPEGKVDISLTKRNNTVTFIAKDNGSGFVYEEARHGLGMELINILVEQINGTIKFKNDNGTEAEIVFTLTEKEEA